MTMRKSQLLANILIKSDALRLVDAFWGPDRLTVLAFHRIVDAYDPHFAYYSRNVSASPEMFAQQMDFVAKHFNVIDLAALKAFIVEGKPLPPRPLVITFDDGYLDNYLNAYPVLKAHNFPAAIFLITSRMNNGAPLWWDECAYYIHHTKKQEACLPLIGHSDLSTPRQRFLSCEALIRAIKTIPEICKNDAIQAVSLALDVPTPTSDPQFMTWEQVREVVANGITCQPHTVSHPILTRVSTAEVYRQIKESREQVEAETGQEIIAFVYPNGTLHDYDCTTLEIVRDLGYSIAFTYLKGPMRSADVRRHPLEISRVHIDYRDSLEIFAMKVTGAMSIHIRNTFVEEGV
jgi:peptidoglycan/xylan/chitin deacetylase (PgdA/CDA1 family)